MVMQRAQQAESAGAGSPQGAAAGVQAATVNMAAVQDQALAGLRQLLRIEAEIRACQSLSELSVLLVNELSRVMGARQAYSLSVQGGAIRITQVSGTQSIDRTSPTVRWLEQELAQQKPSAGWAQPGALTLRCGPGAADAEARLFPFPQGYWLPTVNGGRASQNAEDVQGVVVLAEQGFSENPVTIGQRIAATAAHAARVLVQTPPRKVHSRTWRMAAAATVLATAVALAWPVPMTALAPMEIVPQDAFVVAAPIDGVIDEIVVAPNSAVKAGDLIVRYVDTAPRNQLQIAEREMSVADAKLRQLQQMIFVDDRAKRELAQARAELALKTAERNFARDTFEKSQIRAPRDGIALFADRKDWTGKPVATGQRILEIADVDHVELRAHLPVGDILDLKPGARVRGFLDNDPLKPVEAVIVSMSHQARVVEGLGLTYRVQAKLADGQALPRPGVRGTAQLFSGTVPLGFYLFRRPLTWARQKAGL